MSIVPVRLSRSLCLETRAPNWPMAPATSTSAQSALICTRTTRGLICSTLLSRRCTATTKTGWRCCVSNRTWSPLFATSNAPVTGSPPCPPITECSSTASPLISAWSTTSTSLVTHLHLLLCYVYIVGRWSLDAPLCRQLRRGQQIAPHSSAGRGVQRVRPRRHRPPRRAQQETEPE